MRIESGKRKVETSALVSSGFESGVPLAALPLRLAEKLGFRAKGLEEESYLGPRGVAIIFYPIRKKLRISVVTKDRMEGPVGTKASISLGERRSDPKRCCFERAEYFHPQFEKMHMEIQRRGNS